MELQRLQFHEQFMVQRQQMDLQKEERKAQLDDCVQIPRSDLV